MVKKKSGSRIAKDAHAAENYVAVIDARNRLVSSMLSLGWRMAIAIMLPIFIGLKLDERYNTKPSFVLSCFFIGLAGSAYLIYNEYKEINIETEAMMSKSKSSETKRKRSNKV